tara:strand:- start:3276 stop:3569 length:294 start_codon:yes stop_codon:yes gene_type:complete
MIPKQILIEASKLVSEERAVQHGDFHFLHERIAELWSVYLKTTITPQQVAFCMVLLKVARDELGTFNPDDGKDATAYTALWGALSHIDHELKGKDDV